MPLPPQQRTASAQVKAHPHAHGVHGGNSVQALLQQPQSRLYGGDALPVGGDLGDYRNGNRFLDQRGGLHQRLGLQVASDLYHIRAGIHQVLGQTRVLLHILPDIGNDNRGPHRLRLGQLLLDPHLRLQVGAPLVVEHGPRPLGDHARRHHRTAAAVDGLCGNRPRAGGAAGGQPLGRIAQRTGAQNKGARQRNSAQLDRQIHMPPPSSDAVLCVVGIQVLQRRKQPFKLLVLHLVDPVVLHVGHERLLDFHHLAAGALHILEHSGRHPP